MRFVISAIVLVNLFALFGCSGEDIKNSISLVESDEVDVPNIKNIADSTNKKKQTDVVSSKQNSKSEETQNHWVDTIYYDSCYCIVRGGIVNGGTDYKHSICLDDRDSLRSSSKESKGKIIFKDSFDRSGNYILGIHANDTVRKKW